MYEEKLASEGRILIDSITGKINIIDKTLLEEKESDLDKVMDEIEEDGGDEYTDQYSNMNETERRQRRKEDGKLNNNSDLESNDHKNKKKKKMSRNKGGEGGKGPMKTTYKDATKTSLEERVTEREKEIRSIRCYLQFTAREVNGINFGNQLKVILHDMIMASKKIGNKVRLLPWRSVSGMKSLAGPEINLIGDMAILDYVKTPRGTNTY